MDENIGGMRLIDNVNQTLKDDLRRKIKSSVRFLLQQQVFLCMHIKN